jgi:hypothetical protein
LWWAVVTRLPCHAWHGWELGGAPAGHNLQLRISLPSYPMKGKSNLGQEESSDGRSSAYLERGCAWIESRPSITCATGDLLTFPPQRRHDRNRITT